jgi:hypothetical protein
LGVGGDATGVVVADHDDEAGTDDGQEGEDLGPPGPARSRVSEGDGAERAFDVTDVLLIEDGAEIARYPDAAS